MKANELRIGNYFNPIDRSSKIHLPVNIVFEIKYFCRFDGVVACKPDENIATIKEPFEFLFKDMSPIPLTEEWLLRFGFNKDGILFEQSKNSKFAVKIWEVGKPGQFLIFWGDNILTGVEPVFVNQLQNLYFALTGEEL